MNPTPRALVTPATWFDVGGPGSASADARAWTALGPDGRAPLADVALAEIRAVHFTFGAWRQAMTGDRRAATTAIDGMDRLLAETRAIVRQRAEQVLTSGDVEPAAPLTFPGLSHSLLADSTAALDFLRNFLALPESRSMAAWTEALASRDDAPALARTRPWLRVLLQKAAADNDLPAARTCLLALYDGPDRGRETLRQDETQALAAAGLDHLVGWARALGLDRPQRTARPWPQATRPTPSSADAPLVTVLIPAYRHGEFIERAIESVLAQTDAGLRVLVVDDCSPDDTVARAREVVDPRVAVHVNHTRLGLGDSVLAALDRVDTPYLALLNSDDVFAPTRLARCLARLAADPHTQVVATGLVPIDADDRSLGTDTMRTLFDGRAIANWLRWFEDECRVTADASLLDTLLARNVLVTSSNVVCRTAFLRRVTPRLRGLQFCLDWQVFLDAAAEAALAYDPAPLLGYRLHRTNTVWFDEARGVAYCLEANRVLASVLRALAPGRPNEDAPAVAAFLTRLSRHAARHSAARGLALFAADVLDGRALEAARQQSAAVHQALAEVTAAPPSNDAETRTTARRVAAEILAEIEREEAATATAAVLAAAERRHEARTADEVERAVAARAAADASANAQALAHAIAQTMAETKTAPEWLLGDRLWNGARLRYLGVPAVRALHTARDLHNRGRLALAGLAHRLGLARPGAVVAACWSFPIHSQTFVYQEMTALAWTGLDCRVFCCDTNPLSELPAAFAGLWPKRLVMQTDWDRGQRDLAHFRRTRPERVESLLATLAQATGQTSEALLGESIVLTGFTFARHVELARARYLHTYFFYDQSFLALMAAFLLGIPRGITAYADHMMGDYAFKLVPLHLALADIVVATSERIKHELGAIGGGRFDDKIIVKPNGIDSTRFRQVSPENRLASGGVPELVAVNRIEPKKGMIHLVDAMAVLRDRGVTARLNIVGGVDMLTPTSAACHRELAARIDDLGLQDAVVLHGVKQQHEFAPIVARSRIFVAPYVQVGTGDKDGIPTALLEAMSTGLPIVATDAGSITEACRDGVEGLIVPQRDAAALADALQRLLTARDLYVRMADAARARAVTEFDITVTERCLHERIAQHLARIT